MSRPTYRVFISSSSHLLTEERNALKEIILSRGCLPVAMEYHFTGTNQMYSLDIDMDKINNSDCVIIVLGHLYGSMIDSRIGVKDGKKVCPWVKDGTIAHDNCEECYGSDKCHLGFTQFEFHYAERMGKPIYAIVNSFYDKQSAFEKANEKNKRAGGTDHLTAWGKGRDKNRSFVEMVKRRHVYEYQDLQTFQRKCNEIMDDALQELYNVPDAGLISFREMQQLIEGTNPIYKPIVFFNQDVRPPETTLRATLKGAKKFYFMARTGVTFLSRYMQDIKNEIDKGCECRFLILSPESDMIKNGRYETTFDQKNAASAIDYLRSIRDHRKDKVKVCFSDYYPTFDIEYFEYNTGNAVIVVQSHFLISHIGPDRPMFMLKKGDFWFQTFKDELDKMWEYNEKHTLEP